MANLEKKIKNRITFNLHQEHTPSSVNIPTMQLYLSNNIFTPEKYSLKFVKEKVKAFACYLFSCYVLENRNRGNQRNGFSETIKIYLLDPFSDDHILIRNLLLNQENLHHDNFLIFFDILLNSLEENVCYEIPLKPFKIMMVFKMYLESNQSVDEEINAESNDHVNDEINYESDESVNEEINLPKILTEPSFKCVECVICLTNLSNVLFCDCGHICICFECDILKCLDTCPMCRVKSTIKRKIV